MQGLDTAQAFLEFPDLHIVEPGPDQAPAPAPDHPNRKPPKERDGRARQTGHGPNKQPKLPRETVEHRFSEAPECPTCCGYAKLFEGQYEESEEITVMETSFKVTVHRRAKYLCSCQGAVLTAPGPDKLIPGGRYSVDFAIYSAVEKFADHCPLARQVRRMARSGLKVSTQTLFDQQAALAEHLEPTWRRLWELALAEDVLHADETSWKMMGSKTKPNWTLFGLTAPNLAVYHLANSKSTEAVREILAGFQGTLVVDGYKVYPIVAALEEEMAIAHCWAHTDRKFKEAKDPPAQVSAIRSLIAKLYELEREVKGSFPGPEAAQKQRHKLRKEHSSKIIEQIRETAFSFGGLRRSAFGNALQYMLAHWNGLTRFLLDPRIALDNNAAERALRGPVVGRKNFYGNRSKRGAKTAAILYSLIETAKLCDINPSEYLREAAVAAIRSPGTATLPF